MFAFIKKLFGPPTNYNALIEKGAVIVDVRTAGEYANGHIRGSKNISLDGINSRVAELKKQVSLLLRFVEVVLEVAWLKAY